MHVYTESFFFSSGCLDLCSVDTYVESLDSLLRTLLRYEQISFKTHHFFIYADILRFWFGALLHGATQRVRVCTNASARTSHSIFSYLTGECLLPVRSPLFPFSFFCSVLFFSLHSNKFCINNFLINSICSMHFMWWKEERWAHFSSSPSRSISIIWCGTDRMKYRT